MVTAYGTQVNDRVLFDFGTSDRFGRWIIVNDDVMGGRSRSEMILTDEGTALFQGTLSLENHGGFASVRTLLPSHTLDGYQGLVLRVRGDGHFGAVATSESDLQGFSMGGQRPNSAHLLAYILAVEPSVADARGHRPAQRHPVSC